jgi:hypothetical protein
MILFDFNYLYGYGCGLANTHIHILKIGVIYIGNQTGNRYCNTRHFGYDAKICNTFQWLRLYTFLPLNMLALNAKTTARPTITTTITATRIEIMLRFYLKTLTLLFHVFSFFFPYIHVFLRYINTIFAMTNAFFPYVNITNLILLIQLFCEKVD